MARRGSFSASLNRYIRETEKQERARQREIAREIKYQEKLLKEKAKDRKEQARSRGYVFQKDNKSKIDDAARISASCKDYVFYQFFALKEELKELTLEQQNELLPKKNKFQAEWKVNDLPEIDINIEKNCIEEDDKKYDFSGVFSFLGTVIFIWFLIIGFIWMTDSEDISEKDSSKSSNQQIEYSNYSNSVQQSESTNYYNDSKSDYKNKSVELDEEDIERFNKANERYERNIAKYNKKMERKAEKQKQKLEKKMLKEEKKELKKREKELKKQEKKKKKKDKE